MKINSMVEEIENHIFNIINRPIINLDLAGILFVAACSNFHQGKEDYLKLQSRIKSLKSDIEKNRLDGETFTPEFKTSMFSKLCELELLYEPVVRHFSSAKILAVNSAEAYINEVAGCELKGKQFDEFDKLSLVGKWLFLPPLLKISKRFSHDKNPLQGFVTLVKERNKLVHFKGSRVTLNNPELPNFLESFNLTPSSCKANIENVKTMIKELSLSWVGSYGPDWLNALNKAEFRRPCFYIAARNCPTNLFSEKVDPPLS
ncbi:MAG TPA: hypothetical protein PL009_02140 [Flavipsychrobacter sp.]|nr:hypothetical protein [Flavipsychrobacter sp.]